MASSGKIGYVRIEDGSVRYPVTEIIRYMEQNGIKSNLSAYGECISSDTVWSNKL